MSSPAHAKPFILLLLRLRNNLGAFRQRGRSRGRRGGNGIYASGIGAVSLPSGAQQRHIP